MLWEFKVVFSNDYRFLNIVLVICIDKDFILNELKYIFYVI